MVYDSLDGQKAQCGPGGRAAPRGLHLLSSVRWLRVCCQPRGPARSCATWPWRTTHRGISSLIGSVLGHRSAHMSRRGRTHTHWDIMGEGIRRKRKLNTGWRNTLLQWFFETAYPPTYTHTWTQTDERTRQRARTRTHTNKSWEILGLRTTVLFRLMLSDLLILRNAWNWEHTRAHTRAHRRTHTHTGSSTNSVLKVTE